MTLAEGSVLNDRYRLDRRIATGGMGEVWRASDTTLGRTIAVKVLKAEYVDDSDFLQRFRAEARHAAALSHPGIATVFDYGEVDDVSTGSTGTAYLVMEFVDGEPLSRVLADAGRLEPARALDIVAQSAAALQAAHLAGVIHRDVKPGNLMVRRDGVVKITDFGIARASDGVPLTQTGTVLGTAYYLSPEQASAQTTTPASDVYSLGVVLYEMLAGRRPFTGGNQLQVAMMHTRDTPPPLPGDVPDAVVALTAQMMARDPAQRPESAGAAGRAAAALADQVRTGRLPADLTQVLPRTAAGAGLIASGANTAAMPSADVLRARTEAMRSSARPVPPADRTSILPPVVDDPPTRQVASQPPARHGGRNATLVTIGLLILFAVVAGLLKFAADDGAGSAVTIPTLLGKNVDDATAELTDLGLKVTVQTQVNPDVEPDNVFGSTPTQGSPATKGDTVTLAVSSGSDRVQVSADDYEGRQFVDVRRELEALGLQVKPDYVTAGSDDQPIGTVLSLNPTGSLPQNGEIRVEVVDRASPSPSPPPPPPPPSRSPSPSTEPPAPSESPSEQVAPTDSPTPKGKKGSASPEVIITTDLPGGAG